jgi:hypothetical protein
MNIDPNYPCEICRHEAYKHYKSVIETVVYPLCAWCLIDAYEHRKENNREFAHKFVGDNLVYLESKIGTS